MSLRSRNKPPLPITKKVTLWYTAFILILLVVIIIASFFLTGRYMATENRRELNSSVEEIANGEEDFTIEDDGIRYYLYSPQGVLEEGDLLESFDYTLPLAKDGLKTVTFDGETFYFRDDRIRQGKYAGYWVRGLLPSSYRDPELLAFPLAVTVLSPVLLLIIAFGGYRILKRAFRPVREITETAEEISRKGDFSGRVPVPEERDEIYKMATVFNEMLDSLEDSYQREKQFSSDVSHELRTPVSVILSESEYGLAYTEDINEAKESFEVILRQSKRMSQMIEEIMEITRLEKTGIPDVKKINFSDLTEEAVDNIRLLAAGKSVTVTEEITADLHVKGNRMMLERLIDNLLSNALKFTNTKIHITLKDEGENIRLIVSDDGPGIPKKEMKYIWNRFYQVEESRTKGKNSGAGLGLSLVKKVTEIHNGSVFAKNNKKGASFILTLPKMK